MSMQNAIAEIMSRIIILGWNERWRGEPIRELKMDERIGLNRIQRAIIHAYDIKLIWAFQATCTLFKPLCVFCV